ncbi:MAG: ACP S-malonyltransferase [Dehalococcoidales bacterium]|nr:ACP S-malonyltransferase [Dehalococcoidales bacterium]
MSGIAWVFPGQGSQAVGMCRDLYENVRSAREVFTRADEALGFSLSRLCFEGPEEELRKTVNAQPALVTAAFACLEAARELAGDKLKPPAYVAGHSLGEYTALAASNALDFPTAVKLARRRGELMHDAGTTTPGSMAAIIGLAEDVLAGICGKTGTVMANINCPGQIVISGAVEAVNQAMELAKSAGASRCIPLQVSGAFHSPLMKPAQEGLARAIRNTTFKDPSIPVIANVTAMPLTTAEAIREELVAQLTSPVQWQRSVEYMVSRGVDTFIEIGPGRVLAGLIRRIDKTVTVLNINDLESARSAGK